jgi:hypothetical protein
MKISYPNSFGSDLPFEYSPSPLKEFGAARTVSCQNSECSVYKRTFFRTILITQYIYHEKQNWTCAGCATRYINKVEYKEPTY